MNVIFARRVGFVPSLKGVLLGVVIATISSVLVACAPPKAELNAYTMAFEQVRASTEEMILRGKNDADTVSRLPGTGKSVAQRVADLRANQEALDARMDALDAVAAYNRALVALTTRGDPAELSASLTTFKDAAAKLVPAIAKFAGPAGGAIDALSFAVTAVEDAIRAKRFKDAVISGEPLLPGIFGILNQDAHSLVLAHKSLLNKDYNDSFAQFKIACIVARQSLNRVASNPTIDDLFAQINVQRARVAVDPFASGAPDPSATLKPISHAPASGAAAFDKESVDVAMAVTQVQEITRLATHLEELQFTFVQLDDMVKAYEQQTDAVNKAFKVLGNAVRNPQIDTQYLAESLVSASRAYKKARLAFEESR
ncbi:MAG: hypothetical protein JSR77_00330 [Planctomycetes bacterium]|nr:hypothetical protein [Planctomycetota bacterium]